jgi:hypothetical protein
VFDREHVACIGEMRNTRKVLIRIPERRDHLKDLGIDERTVTLREEDRKLWTGFIRLRIETGDGPFCTS